MDMLTFEGQPFAVPAFRIIAIVDGETGDERALQCHGRIYALFEASFGADAKVASYHFDRHKGRFAWMKPSLVAEGRRFFTRGRFAFTDGIRRYGMVPEAFDNPALPYFGIENRRGMTGLELALPIDAGNIGFAMDMLDALGGAPVIWGVMGYGFFVPPYKRSLAFMLGQASRRYRTAIEIWVKMVDEGIRREGSYYRWKEGEEPGIGDVGWHTLVGREFWPRLPADLDSQAAAARVAVTRGPDVLTLTAGPRPIWGDVQAGEDIAAYRAAAALLRPIRFPAGCGHVSMFNGDHPDRVDAYLARFD
ncbi:hypothetical protein BN1110_03964 [bacterium YEK0313]|nr:hypothetical protein BN1110_03964 [bacterium YEK0313]